MMVCVGSRKLLAHAVIVTLDGEDVTLRAVAADDIEGWVEMYDPWPPKRDAGPVRRRGVVTIELKR